MLANLLITIARSHVKRSWAFSYFDLTSPLFDKVVIQIDKRYNGGKSFVIRAKNNSKENVYIQSAKLNGKPLRESKLSFYEWLRKGFWNMKWGLNLKKDGNKCNV